MGKSARAAIRITISLLVSVTFIYFIVFDPPLSLWLDGTESFLAVFFTHFRIGGGELSSLLQQMQVGYFLLAFPAILIATFVRSLRWRTFITGLGDISISDVFHSVCLGFALNNILPMRIGDMARTVVVAKRSGISVGSVITTIGLEQLFDLSCILLLLGVSMLFVPFPDWIQFGGIAVGLVVVFGFAMLIVFAGKGQTIEHALNVKKESWPGFIKAIMDFLMNMVKGAKVVGKPQLLLRAFAYTLGYWLSLATASSLVILAFSGARLPDYPPFLMGVVTNIIGAFGMAIPAAPGGVGTFHGIAAVALALFGFSQAKAIVIATGIHAVNYITICCLGLISYFRLGAGVSGLLAQSRSLQEKQEDN